MTAIDNLSVVDGTVSDLFGHRFVITTSNGKILADLGPEGTDRVTLAVGDYVVAHGERKPSELKVQSLTLRGRTIAVRPKTDDHEAADAGPALATVKAAGFEPVGEPKRKPKHFEITGRRDDEHVEFHVGLDGDIRKRKTIPSHEPRA